MHLRIRVLKNVGNSPDASVRLRKLVFVTYAMVQLLWTSRVENGTRTTFRSDEKETVGTLLSISPMHDKTRLPNSGLTPVTNATNPSTQSARFCLTHMTVATALTERMKRERRGKRKQAEFSLKCCFLCVSRIPMPRDYLGIGTVLGKLFLVNFLCRKTEYTVVKSNLE